MNDSLTSKMLRLFESACIDKPLRPSVVVKDGCFNMTITGNRDQWTNLTAAACVPSHAEQKTDGETLMITWPSIADQIFGEGGLLSKHLRNYQPRPAQLHMARLVQRSIEMRQPAMIEAGTGTGKCLHPDTLITLANGVQCPISALGHGVQETILQLDGQMKMAHAAYAKCWASGEKQTYKITTRLGREIKASADHRFMTVDGWKRLEELTSDDNIASPRFIPEPLYVYPMPEAEIRFLAYMISDGCCSHAGYRGAVTYTKGDPAVIDDLALAVAGMENVELNQLKPMRYSIRRKVAREGLEWKRNSASVLLETMGLAGKKSQDKTIPDCIFSLPNAQLSIFLGCLFSGDGTVDKSRSVIEFYSMSHRMLEQVQHLLLRFGIVSRLSVKNGRYLGEVHKSWRLTISGIPNIQAFRENILLVGSKQIRLEQVDLTRAANPNYDVIPKTALQNKHLPKRFGVSPAHHGVSRRNMALIAEYLEDSRLSVLANSDIYWDQIVSIEPAEIVETYDIEMSGEHNFLANGFIVHNSFAYAAVCMAMNKKVVIAAPTLALQMQLYKKDIPFLQTIFPGKKVELAMGKTNYVCKSKTEDQQAGAYKLANQEFINWYEQTATGNLLEFPLQLTTDDQKAVAVDDDCTGKHCSNYGNCFYYDAKGRRNEADVVITNHSLVALHTLIPTAKLLPSAFDVLVIDEAHQLPDYVRNALGSEITVNSISKVLDKALKQVNSNITIERELRQYLFSLIDSAQAKKHLLVAEVSEFLKDKEGREVGIFGDHIFKTGQSLSNTMYSLAADIWPEDEMPNCPEDVLQSKAASRVRRMADNVYAFSDKTQPGEVRYINVTPERNIYNVTPFDVSEFIGMLAGYASKPACIATPTKQDYTLCARCGRTLTADKVAILDGQPYGPDCIQKIDALGDADIVSLQDWLEQQHAPSETQPSEPLRQLQAMPVIFCSATIAAPDMSSFMRECGIANGLQMQALSPFDYQSNSLLYVPAGNVPQPNGKESQAHQEFVSQQIQELVQASKGGAFLLFTSFSAMNNALRNLRQIFDYRGWPVLVQGEYPKLTLVEKFKASGKAVLFATKSFWEGVDIQGEALRLVVIDKLPFEAPNPINTAQEAALREYAKTELGLSGNKAEWYPFNALRVPKMITDLKQGSGRLIRTAQDYGVIAILDPRIRTTDYGRRMVLPSLPPAQLVDELEMVKDFYRRRMAIAVQPMPDIVSKKTTVDFALVEELPF